MLGEWWTGRGWCEVWLVGPGARLHGGSAVARILDSVLRAIRGHSWDFRRVWEAVGEVVGCLGPGLRDTGHVT